MAALPTGRRPSRASARPCEAQVDNERNGWASAPPPVTWPWWPTPRRVRRTSNDACRPRCGGRCRCCPPSGLPAHGLLRRLRRAGHAGPPPVCEPDGPDVVITGTAFPGESKTYLHLPFEVRRRRRPARGRVPLPAAPPGAPREPRHPDRARPGLVGPARLPRRRRLPRLVGQPPPRGLRRGGTGVALLPARPDRARHLVRRAGPRRGRADGRGVDGLRPVPSGPGRAGAGAAAGRPRARGQPRPRLVPRRLPHALVPLQPQGADTAAVRRARQGGRGSTSRRSPSTSSASTGTSTAPSRKRTRSC